MKHYKNVNITATNEFCILFTKAELIRGHQAKFLHVVKPFDQKNPVKWESSSTAEIRKNMFGHVCILVITIILTHFRISIYRFPIVFAKRIFEASFLIFHPLMTYI